MSSLSKAQIDTFLGKAQSASLATIDSEGYPYNLPVNFIWQDGKIYIHGRIVGTKVSNIEKNSKVGLAIYEMGELDYDPNQEMACEVMVHYDSVVIKGDAKALEDPARKMDILWAIIKKYAPSLEGADMPDEEIAATSVFEITPVSCTGKAYPDK